MNSDPGSLQNLNDIVLPAEVPWWPVAPGWYLLLGIAVLLLVYFSYRAIQHRSKNRYRRLALRELSEIRQQADRAALQKLPIVLKRTALSAWPRGDVAALSGPEWHRFLDRTAATERFSSGAGALLDELAYGDAEEASTIDRIADEALEAVEFWLRRHRCEPAAR